MPFSSTKQRKFVMAKMRYFSKSPYEMLQKYPEKAGSTDFAIVKIKNAFNRDIYRPRVYVFGKNGRLIRMISFPCTSLYKMDDKGRPTLR